MCNSVGCPRDVRFIFELFILRHSSRGSPMVIGVKCADQLATNHIPVMFSKGKN